MPVALESLRAGVLPQSRLPDKVGVSTFKPLLTMAVSESTFKVASGSLAIRAPPLHRQSRLHHCHRLTTASAMSGKTRKPGRSTFLDASGSRAGKKHKTGPGGLKLDEPFPVHSLSALSMQCTLCKAYPTDSRQIFQTMLPTNYSLGYRLCCECLDLYKDKMMRDYRNEVYPLQVCGGTALSERVLGGVDPKALLRVRRSAGVIEVGWRLVPNIRIRVNTSFAGTVQILKSEGRDTVCVVLGDAGYSTSMAVPISEIVSLNPKWRPYLDTGNMPKYLSASHRANWAMLWKKSEAEWA